MKSTEKLYLAIGEIDEKLIEEATSPVKKIAIPIRRFITIAASIVIICTVAIASLNYLGDLFLPKNGGNAAVPPTESEDNIAAPDFGGSNNKDDELLGNNMFYSDIGSLMLVGREGNKFSFILNLISPTDTPIHIHSYDEKDNKISSSDSTSGLANSPIIYVDGKEVDSLPCEMGIYYLNIVFPNWDTESSPEFDGNESLNPEGPSAPGEPSNPDDPSNPGESSKPTNPPVTDSQEPSYFIIDGFGPIPFSYYD